MIGGAWRSLASPPRTSLAGAILAISVLALGPGAASADPYGVGGPDAGFRPDNGEHTYCFGGDYTGDNARDGAHTAFTTLQNQTTMISNFLLNCSGTTDARFAIFTNPGLDGRWTCTAIASTNPTRCEHAVLEFNRQNVGSQADWRQSACHETGHSVGLHHGNDDCLGGDGSGANYSGHHVAHVNNDR